MKIEPDNSKKNIAKIDDCRSLNNRNFCIDYDLHDFESYIKELDEDKDELEAQSLLQIAATAKHQLNSNVSDIQDKTDKLMKISSLDFISDKKRSISGYDRMAERTAKDSDDKIGINFDDFKKEDLDLFKAFADNPNIYINNINAQNLQVCLAAQGTQGTVSYKSFDVSKGLFNLIEYSLKSKKPVRLDFKGDSSVILKMNKEGKLIAEFLSNNEAMAYILKSSIPNLRNKMDSEGIPYDDIFYNDNKQNKNKKQNRGDDK